MGLEIQRRKDGTLRSKWWYGRFEVNGSLKCINLGVKISGDIPKLLCQRGDDTFESSRLKAQFKLDQLKQDATSRKTAAHHLQELYEIKSGEEMSQIPLTDLEEQWELLPAKRKRADQKLKAQRAHIKQFRAFIQGAFPQAKMMSQITRKMALSWMRDLDAKRQSSATYNTKLSLLRGLFEKIGPQAGVLTNPFAGIPYHETSTVHRQPFTQDELNAILEHCDDLMRPVVLTAMCTAMRRGDCCLLKWESVDLEHGFIAVKTSKTGELAEIPLFPLLRDTLEKLERKSVYVFPEAATMYQENHHGLSWRFRKALEDAGIENTQVKRDDASQKASVKDFHSLRTTWITMALTAGVPMELVRRVTGHSTVNIVLKHYFRPGREAFRTALQTAMPKMLTGGAGERPDPVKAFQELAQAAPELKPEELVKRIKELAAVLAA